MHATLNEQNLRYMDAAHVVHPNGTLEGLEVQTREAQPLGRIGGVLLEPARRKVRFFVVECAALLSRRRYLVPADRGATLDAEKRTIHIDIDPRAVRRFDPRTVPLFSDQDLLDAVFATSAA
ncbi:MAG TPA: PRC-barrel domain-containing protein [Vicinamibacterales bacterium]|jgi:hypothetical protein|nr:PRC-barrel domain-containing protein [Vicinamibacterales bacterium]